MNKWLRNSLLAAGAAFAAWIGVQIYRAGGDIPPPPTRPQTMLKSGHAEGRRLRLPSWSLDYDSITTSADNTIATLENVRRGTYYKNGKPFMSMTSKHVVVNTVTNDFVATGPLTLVQIDGQHDRRFSSDAATYSGLARTLTLNHPATIRDDAGTIEVKRATINFKTGDMTLGPLVGTY
ncbi:MAG: LPS export ABC transporter periplasmic protein LptC [Candidatus Velthaea sp.]